MLAEERRNQLLELIRQKGFASLPELARSLDVSESTVRRDLDSLETGGMAQRTHGGVFYTGSRPQLPHFVERQPAQWDKKQAIAQVAASLVGDGDTILLDGGTTTYEVARLLVGRQLQVVTNSLPVANLLASRSEIDLVFVGGLLYPRTGVAIGPLANQMLERLKVRRAILSVASATDEGFFNNNLLLVETERAMLRSADEVIVVADSTKFGHPSLALLCPLNHVHRLVADSDLAENWRTKLTAAGIDLRIASAKANGQ